MDIAMKKESLYIYRIDERQNKIKFPNEVYPAKLGEFTYTAQRMAGTPTLTATLNYPSCLDSLWSGNEFVEFRGERYYIDQVPTSSKESSSIMYKHELQFVSERIMLENIYFMDVVTKDLDTYHSNSTSVVFMGDIHEFVARLNASLSKSNSEYTIVIDDGITTDTKLVSLDDVYIAEALQSIHTVYELTYYFVGKTCHVGDTENIITDKFEYRKGLTSITKTNSNYKIVNRATGVGSSDNIPFYYPNDTEDGDIEYEVSGFDKDIISRVSLKTIKKYLSDPIGKTLKWNKKDTTIVSSDKRAELNFVGEKSDKNNPHYSYPFSSIQSASFTVTYTITAMVGEEFIVFPNLIVTYKDSSTSRVYVDGKILLDENLKFKIQNETTIVQIVHTVYENVDDDATLSVRAEDISTISGAETKYGFNYGDDFKEFVSYPQCGITIGDLTQMDNGDSFKITNVTKIPQCTSLMPSIYRETKGEERFYNALNNKYKIPDTDDFYEFKNPYSEANIREIVVNYEDIKPTIEGVKNGAGELFGEIADIAFDENDSDELGDGETNNTFNGTDEYVHSYFYIKLHLYDGEFGFNLFEQGLEGGTAVINMTSGNCSACEFEIGVTYQENITWRAYNPVLVDEQGNLLAGDFEQKVTSQSEKYIDRQQNTKLNEVWIAVKKDNQTQSVVMPNATYKYRPQKGDKFVITGIKMPKSLVLSAEKRLSNALIKYLSENNDEKFTFTLSLSRVFLSNNEQLWNKLNENAKIAIKYNDIDYLLYVNSFTCKADSNCLYDVSVDLVDTLSESNSSLRNMISAIAGDVFGSKLNANNTSSSDVIAQTEEYYISKKVADTAQDVITFQKGIILGDREISVTDEGRTIARLDEIQNIDNITSTNFVSGKDGKGFALKRRSTDTDDDSLLEVDYITARKKVTFFELAVQELKHIGGQQIRSDAAIVCSEVKYCGGSEGLNLLDNTNQGVANWEIYSMKGTTSLKTFSNGVFGEILLGLGGYNFMFFKVDDLMLLNSDLRLWFKCSGNFGETFALTFASREGINYCSNIHQFTMPVGTDAVCTTYLDFSFDAEAVALAIEKKVEIGLYINFVNATRFGIKDMCLLPKNDDADDYSWLPSFSDIGEKSYMCKFVKNDNDGQIIYNEFHVNDLARCETFATNRAKLYWRKVIKVTDDAIFLSEADCLEGSDVPAVGDNIVQLGNTTDSTRQSAQIVSTQGEEAPYYAQYKGISSYSLSGCEKVFISPNRTEITADKFTFQNGDDIESMLAEVSENAKDALSALETMNDDGICDITEKQELMLKWMQISGGVIPDKFSIVGVTGTYNITLTKLKELSIDSTALTTAYKNLRDYLSDVVEINKAEPTQNFNKSQCSDMFASYYNQENEAYNLITNKKLLNTGINIENKEITLTAEKTKIQDTSGNVQALFSDGKINKAFINLGNLQLTSENIPTVSELTGVTIAIGINSEVLNGYVLSSRETLELSDNISTQTTYKIASTYKGEKMLVSSYISKSNVSVKVNVQFHVGWVKYDSEGLIIGADEIEHTLYNSTTDDTATTTITNYEFMIEDSAFGANENSKNLVFWFSGSVSNNSQVTNTITLSVKGFNGGDNSIIEKDVQPQTILGANGFLTAWDNNCYSIVSGSDGNILMYGLNGLRIWTGGVQQTFDGGITWKALGSPSEVPSMPDFDYNLLANKPQINNITLNGNKSADDLGLVDTDDSGTSEGGSIQGMSYRSLYDKPKINSVILDGDKTTKDLDMIETEDVN